MSQQKEASAELAAMQHVFDAVWNWAGGGDVGRWFVLIVVSLIALLVAGSLFLKALSKAVDGIEKLTDFYKSSGLPMRMSAEDKQRVRYRAQFCGVLESDLAQLAKFESWNDQWFTDLEAEVESEGGYYPTAFHRWIGRPSYGLRKERSLIKAITKSTERAIQLTGEPGAGKSVALRHLAAQLAAKGKKSKDKQALIPLYINLREMASSDIEKVNVDLIRDFILDNIRRGDSDTTAFVRENWIDYRDKGVWFFLFDSFDEIPAVLHAEKGSASAFAYSQAIRQFLEGMGTCKGVLASREFKGPEELPWRKFRILPLNIEKQKELVSNAILKPEQTQIVLRHLASGGPLGTTPLFLTLLCRYVKSEDRAPKNDHDLLSLHIDRLAQKEQDYLKRKYGFTPNVLLEGAERVARLFAEQPTLGLAPTLDQITALIQKEEVPGGDLPKLISALVDCKLGRADVPNATQGDRRFAFAHRRYQESLFVRFLVRHPGHVSPPDLLSDPRWREYTVTLLQTEPLVTLEPILGAAASLLRDAHQSWNPARSPAPSDCGYFSWQGELSTYVLELLQEGLARRTEAIPTALSEAVLKLLRPRWEHGDSFDQGEVVRLGSLLPQPVLIKYLARTFKRGTPRAESIAFRQTPAVRIGLPPVIKEAVLKRLSQETLAAQDTAALMQLEALAARLPALVGAMHVYHRNVRLRWILGIIENATRFVFPYRTFDRALLVFSRLIDGQNLRKKAGDPQSAPLTVSGFLVASLCMFTILFSITQPATILTKNSKQLDLQDTIDKLLTWWNTTSTTDKWPALAAATTLIIYLGVIVAYALRAKGERLDPKFIMSRIGNPKALRKYGSLLFFLITVIAILFATAAGMGFAVRWALQLMNISLNSISTMSLGFAATCVLIYGAGLFIMTRTALRSRREVLAFRTVHRQVANDLEAISALQARNSLALCLYRNPNIFTSVVENRSCSAWILSHWRNRRVSGLPSLMNKKGVLNESEVRRCLRLLEERAPVN